MKTIVPRNQLDRTLNSGERQVATDYTGIDKWHLWRYDVALFLIKHGDIVLDVGCGIGYGTKQLAHKALRVLGIDDSQETIEFAKQHFAHPKAEYACLNVESDTVFYEKKRIDVTVMFEVLEHLFDFKKTFKRIAEATKRMMIISVPHVSVDLEKSDFHYKHYTPEEVYELVEGEGFKVTKMDIMDFSKGKAVFCVAERGNPDKTGKL